MNFIKKANVIYIILLVIVLLITLPACTNKGAISENDMDTYVSVPPHTEKSVPSNEPIQKQESDTSTSATPEPTHSNTNSIIISGEEYNKDTTELTLMYSDLSNEDIDALKYMINLTLINLNGTGITDISPLKDLVNLMTLDLCNNKIDDFNALGSLVNLSNLHLMDTGIGNLNILKDLTNLKILTLERNPLTQEQIDDLQVALPHCVIYYDHATE